MPPRRRLTARIVHPDDPNPSAEDIFCSGLETLFTDDTQQSHGMPGQSIIYRSPRFGDVYLRIPAHPDEEGGRRLFAHYLWNAGVLAADAIERASCDDNEADAVENGDEDRTEGGNGEKELSYVVWNKRFWDMRGRDVLELGAATALPSLICALSNARSVTSTDHPSSPAITTNAIASNFQINFLDRGKSMPSTLPREQGYTNDAVPMLNHPQIQSDTVVSIYWYMWGTTMFTVTGSNEMEQPKPRSFDRIVLADCLWMPEQHENLVRTIVTYLTPAGVDEQNERIRDIVPCALVVAGFHMGREIVGSFIEIATGNSRGDAGAGDGRDGCSRDQIRGQLRILEIFEVDVDGRRRSWKPRRPTETREQSKRWCMCAALARR